MEKALEIINSNKIYIEIFKNVMKKYKQYSKITGYFNITPKNNEEMDILASFDTNVYNNKKAKIKSKDVEKLFTKKLKNFDFLQLLSVVTKEELITNKQVREILVNNEVEFFSTLIKFCENGIGKEWIISALQKKLYGYPSIKKLYKKALDESNINYLKEDLIKCINAINNLPYLENKYESLAIFSARHTKDPHFFDKDSIYGKLLINALVYKDSQGVNKNEINNIDKLNKLYYRFGLLKDEISNSTCIYKLTGELEGNRIDFLNMINEPFNISLSNIQKLDYIICKNNRVFIFENPAVFQSIIQDTDIDESIICTSGQLNLSSYMLLNKIKNLDKIYYAGDFDPEGLQIADKLKDLYKDKVEFMLYDEKYYEKIISDKELDLKRIGKLKSIKDNDLNKMVDEIENVESVNLVLSPSQLSDLAIPDEMIPDDVKDIFESDRYKMIFVNSTEEIATNKLNKVIDKIDHIIKKYDKNAIMAGEGPCMKDLVNIADEDFRNVSIASIGIIFIIMLFVLKSISLPVLLVSGIELAIFINMAISYYTGDVLPFVASIVIGTIQLGATIDYAILLTTKYLENRKNGIDKIKAMDNAISNSAGSIFVSGMSFFAATFGVGMISKLNMIASLCNLMSRGALISMFIVICVIPAILLVFDKVIIHTSIGFKQLKNKGEC